MCRPKLLYYTDTFCRLSETWAFRLAHAIEGFQVHVLTHALENPEIYPLRGLPVTIVPRAPQTRLGRAMAGVRNALQHKIRSSSVVPVGPLQKALADNPPVACLAHFGSCGTQILPYCRTAGIPLLTLLHGCDLGSWLRLKRYPANLARLFSEGNAFATPTNYMRKKAIRLGCPAEKTHIAPIASIDEPPVVERFPSSDGRTRFLFVGRLHPQKGPIEMIRAFHYALQSSPAASLTLIGEGPLRGEIEALVKELELSDRVTLQGALPYPEVAAAYATHDVFVIHSKTTEDGDEESFGAVLAEASSHEMAIVATRHNGFPEVAPHGVASILVEEGDWKAMGEAMTELAKNPNRRQSLGIGGRAHVLNSFTSAHSARAIESALKSILE